MEDHRKRDVSDKMKTMERSIDDIVKDKNAKDAEVTPQIYDVPIELGSRGSIS